MPDPSQCPFCELRFVARWELTGREPVRVDDLSYTFKGQTPVAQALAVVGDVRRKPSGQRLRFGLIGVPDRRDQGQKRFVERLHHAAQTGGSWLKNR